MAAKNPEAAALAARCKAIGWRVETMRSAGGAYKVFMADCDDSRCNHILQLHMTPSDTNWRAAVLRELNRHGLDALEAKRAKQRDDDKAARLAEARHAAEARSRELLAQAGHIRRAAGPYAGPELVELEWFLRPHPAPTMRWVIMTPELARQILDKTNLDNRALSPGDVEFKAGVIASNQWHLTHQGGAHDTNGVLQDGQHRLEAICQAGIAVPMAWFAGMDPNNWKAIDEGLARTASQLLGKLGEHHTLVVQAASKLIIAYDSPGPTRKAYHRKRSNEEIIDAFTGDADELRAAIRWAVGHKKTAETPASPMAAARYLTRRANGPDNPYVEAFWRGYVSQRKLDPKYALDVADPRLAARRQFVNARARNKRATGLEALALLLLAFNHTIEGRTRGHLTFRADMAMPRVVRCDPASSAVPHLLQGEIDTAAAAA